MPRTFTAFVGQTPDPETVHERFRALVGEDLVDGDVDRVLDETAPREPVEGRVRFDLGGWHEGPIGDAIEAGRLGPLEWAVVSVTMDEAIGVNAWVYDGDEQIDSFEGHELHGGADTEAYLERYHGVNVKRAGTYRRSRRYHPSLDLARRSVAPERTLADEPPTGPFEVTDAEEWLVVEGRVDDPDAFVDWFEQRLRESGMVLTARDELDSPWVTDGPVGLERESPTADDPGRVRVRVPLTGIGITDEGLLFGVGPESRRGEGYDGDIDWLVFCHGDAADERVDAHVFAGRHPGRFTFGDGIDHVSGGEGRGGADVAAYLRRVYGWEIDPTPSDVATPPETDDLPPSGPPSDDTVERLREAGIEPGPDLPGGE